MHGMCRFLDGAIIQLAAARDFLEMPVLAGDHHAGIQRVLIGADQRQKPRNRIIEALVQDFLEHRSRCHLARIASVLGGNVDSVLRTEEGHRGSGLVAPNAGACLGSESLVAVLVAVRMVLRARRMTVVEVRHRLLDDRAKAGIEPIGRLIVAIAGHLHPILALTLRLLAALRFLVGHVALIGLHQRVAVVRDLVAHRSGLSSPRKSRCCSNTWPRNIDTAPDLAIR